MTTVSPSVRRLNSGARSISTVRNGAATKNVEIAPRPMPMKSANAKSFSVAPPNSSREPTGRRVMNVVASERRIVSQSETFAIVANFAWA